MEFEDLLNEMVDKGLADRRQPTIVIDHDRGQLDLYEYIEYIAGLDEALFRRN